MRTHLRGARTILSVATLAVAGAVIAGCSFSDFDLDAADAVGVWRAGSGLPAELTLAADGTFTATDWPQDVCLSPAAKTVEQLRDDPAVNTTVDFDGTWTEGDGGSANTVSLSSDSPSCYSVKMDFRRESGEDYMCHWLDVSNELSSAENYFIIYLGEPRDEPKTDACFSYG